MKAVKSLASVVLVGLAAISSQAFASGYGPAPHYSPVDGAPASQRGQSAQTLAAESKASAQDSLAAAKHDSVTNDAGKELASSNRHGSVAVQ
ncbi:hypothetical protein [Caballeronia insecticola]|uniref:Uncharacterized protein n=1 Tax=Caballeronia insecticola TaxID=758793 RepID=R4X4F0_9BURK|nr:hypothetical protein [Caballeronia insecticola]BAN28196.1 putative uncharacterized protein [Caballeronia insecticola]